MIDGWRTRLSRFQGGPRLAWRNIYYDFNWYQVMQHGMSQFPCGLRLTELIRRDCEKNFGSTRTPALVLTTRTDVQEGAVDDGEVFAVVVHVHEYLAFTKKARRADPAATYFAERCKSGITRVVQLADVGSDERGLQEFRSQVAANPEKFEAVARILDEAGVARNAERKVEPETLARFIRGVQSADTEVVEAILEVLPRLADHDRRRTILTVLTSDPLGRESASDVMGQRLVDRLSDTRQALTEYDRLLKNGAGETRLQDFITKHPWIVGLEYATVKPHPSLFHSTTDFLLERFDGLHDIIELKSPEDDVVSVIKEPKGNATPPPSSYSLSRSLANAIAQGHVYRDMLMHGGQALQWQGLHPQVDDPKLFIVIGQRRTMSEQAKVLLREFNRTLHRVEVVPFDDVARRALGIIENIERQLGVLDSERGENSASADGSPASG